MSEINIINKPEAKSFIRKLSELTLTTMVWGLWLYLILPILNVLMWIVGLSTMRTEIFEKGGYLVFIELLQQMGAVVLVAFVIMRLWGYYNYYRFGRHERRSHEMPDSIEKLSRFYQLEPQALVHLETRKEVIWPHRDDSEDAGEWLKKKADKLTPEQLKEDEGNILMRFHDVRESGTLSITKAALTALVFVMILAGIILYAAGGFQKKADISAADIQTSQTLTDSESPPSYQ